MIQEKFIEAVKAKIDPNTKLVSVIAQVLDLSIQGVYKKINQTTNLTLEEVNKIANYLGLSIDQVQGYIPLQTFLIISIPMHLDTNPVR